MPRLTLIPAPPDPNLIVLTVADRLFCECKGCQFVWSEKQPLGFPVVVKCPKCSHKSTILSL